MEFTSILIGMFIGIISVITGIGLKILYAKIRPYLTVLSIVKEFDKPKDNIYETLMNNNEESKKENEEIIKE